MRTNLLLLLFVFIASTAHGWNALGHKVIADIAWEELDGPTREKIVATLRRHPRFGKDFAKRPPAGVEEDRWIFQQAAIWPDMARSLKEDHRKTYDHPKWHYISLPFVIDGRAAPMDFNVSAEYPTQLPPEKWNAIQAVKHCEATIQSDASASDKAIAYCWLIHLVGDAHQPLDSTALVCERFPMGDAGGRSIPTVQGGNLHASWDNLLGRRDGPSDVQREASGLRGHKESWEVDVGGDVSTWIKESHELAKGFAYSPEIIEAVKRPGELQKIDLQEEYLEKAGEHARRRVVAAGVRLSVLLKGAAKSEDASRGIAKLLAGLAVGTPAEYQRIPAIWEHAIAAGKRNDAEEIRGLLELSLPTRSEPLRDWQAVVIGGGVINGISQTGQWPKQRLSEVMGSEPELKTRWKRTIELAAAMADDKAVKTGTRYDALRILGADDYDRRGPQLVRYLSAGVDDELQMGAVSGLSDMEARAVGPALVEALPRLNDENRKLAIEALLRTPERRASLVKAVKDGIISRDDLSADQAAQLTK